MLGAPRSRYLLFAVVCAALIVVGLLVVVEDPETDGGSATSAAEEKPLPPALSPPERAELEKAHAAQQAAGEDVHHHGEPPDRGIEEAAEEFLSVYLPYEVGQGSASAEGDLRALTTAEFADQLLAEAPRFPPGLKRRPREAQLLAIDVVPLDDEAARVVAKLRRGGDLEAAAFELRHIRGRWLVTEVAG